MANSVNLPLSGAVTQAINPWELWIKSISSQMGLINIRNTTSSDPEFEQKVIQDIASYGKQLGKINDVLMAFINNPNLEEMFDKMTEEQKQAINEFKHIVSEIEQMKKVWKSPPKLLASLDSMVKEIKALESQDPKSYEKAIKKIKDNLGLN